MANAVIMPRQGQSVESCILTKWYKSPGDQVSKGDLLFAYETDKAAFEEEAQEDGTLLACFFEAGDEVPVLVNVAVLGKEGEDVEVFRPSGDASPGSGTAVEKGSAVASETTGERTAELHDESVLLPGDVSLSRSISPRARRLAREKRVVLEALKGTGPGGRIIERDVLEAVRQGKRLTPLAQKKKEAEGLSVPSGGKDSGKFTTNDLLSPSAVAGKDAAGRGPASFSDVPLSNVRKIIARSMYNSLRNSAQLTHHLSAGAVNMLKLRREVKARKEDGYPYDITLNDMVCFAVIRSLLLHRGANAHFLGEYIRMFDQVNLGMAVDTDRGLMVPALLNAHSYSLPELSRQLKEMAQDAKKGSISPDLIVPEAATFTVSNLGNYGVEMFTPVINLPQVAILGVNTIIQRPAVLEDGSFGFLPFMGLSLTYDHRALDGGPATLFLAEIKKQIEQLNSGLLD